MKYTNTKSGLTVVTGKVKESNADSFTLTVEYYDRGGQHEEDITILSNEANKPRNGFSVTAVGYPAGPNRYTAQAVMEGNAYFERDGLAVITGFVDRAAVNEEKNADGTARLNKDGQAKKEHFDISVRVKEGDAYVSHRIKIYNSPNETDAIEKAKKSFGRVGQEYFHKEKGATVKNDIVGTFVTQAGSYWESQRNGNVYRNCDHLGLIKYDAEYITRPVDKAKDAPAENKTVEAPVAEQSYGDGFMNIPDGLDEELPFN